MTAMFKPDSTEIQNLKSFPSLRFLFVSQTTKMAVIEQMQNRQPDYRNGECCVFLVLCVFLFLGGE